MRVSLFLWGQHFLNTCARLTNTGIIAVDTPKQSMYVSGYAYVCQGMSTRISTRSEIEGFDGKKKSIGPTLCTPSSTVHVQTGRESDSTGDASIIRTPHIPTYIKTYVYLQRHTLRHI